MTSVNLLSTTPDGQQVLLSTAQPILSAATDPTGIIFTDAPQTKTVLLQDGDPTGTVGGTSSGVEYTIIEDPAGSGGGYLQIANASGQPGLLLKLPKYCSLHAD